jgi:hypothetical protein
MDFNAYAVTRLVAKQNDCGHLWLALNASIGFREEERSDFWA